MSGRAIILCAAGILVLGAVPSGAAPFTPSAVPSTAAMSEPDLVHLAQSRAEVRQERRELREERRELRRAQRAGDRRDIRREWRDVRDARRDVRDARRDFRDDREVRRRYYVRDGRRYYREPNGAEIFAGLVAGAIAAGAANAAAGQGSEAVAYCERRFRSYDRASGTYLGYDGRRHPCP